MTKVAIFGAGQIGRAVKQILFSIYKDIDSFSIDMVHPGPSPISNDMVVNMNTTSIIALELLLRTEKVTHVINAMPFHLNEKIASAALGAKCHYIDFTEDDTMADKVQEIYKDSGLNCAVKCGLAPGFVNYIGYDLVSKLQSTDTLMVSVGALPRNVSFSEHHPEKSYNLSWSVDGLVNEYIRPCRVRKNGVAMEIAPLGGLRKVILDGTEYEAAYTSGGVGSLVKELDMVPNVYYMTLRYPGHYHYVKEVVQENNSDFDKIKAIFLDKFPFTDDDVIIVYSNAVGKDHAGNNARRSYANKFYGVDGLTGIQATTAGSGVAILELFLTGKLQGIVNHSVVKLQDFMATEAVKKYYNSGK